MNESELSRAPYWVHPVAAFIRRMPAGRYRLMNWLPRHDYNPFWAQMSEELGAHSFHCDLRDSIAREVCFTGQYEPQETALVQSLLENGMTFVDVGANWGYYTLLASGLVGSAGKVVSFEPDPRLFQILIDNLRYNELRNATGLQIAAASKTDTLTLSGYDADGENFGLSKLVDTVQGNETTFQVDARSVDDVLDELEIGRVDLLKMDIEGAEDMALRGMSRGLAQHRYRRILLELHPGLLAERGISMQVILDLLISDGYRGWLIDFSSEAVRKAAYASSIRLHDYLRPLDTTSLPDGWPHVLWLAPDTDLPK